VVYVNPGIVNLNFVSWKKEVEEHEGLVLVNFWSHRCPHCRIITPIYSELAEEYEGKLKFTRLNILESHENRELAIKHGVMGTPTFKFYCETKPVQDLVGALPKAQIKQAIDFALNQHKECEEKSTSI
jgi:thioredoxin-like negative regulator of GroEL